ncbi:FtsW/RodA/SpoVE family cell cycle protein, partial [Candidatus Dojkabacteria bacterium]|nr:FtsW/RodA/SpoVE family cell cycle protein [Candidatus Dojkabacteria bacterium]
NSILISLIFFTVLLFRLKITIENLLLAIPLILGIIISLIDAGNINSLYGLDTNFNFIGLIVAIGILIFLSNKLKLNKILLFVFLIIGLLIPLVLSFAYNSILEPYQRERITTFLMPSSEASLDEDFNRQMSVMAVGSGRVFGKGFLSGNIVNSGLLPFAFTDFAFAGFAEQFGFAGSLLIILLYLILIIRMFLIYKNADTDFNKLICIGTIALIFFNFAQHVAMNLGITPITGVPLPLISYGGSSIVSVFLALGLVNSVNLHSKDSDVVVENLHKDYGF